MEKNQKELCTALQALLETEDPRRPLTDIQLAERLDLRREKVSQLRTLLDVEDSRERLKPMLRREMRERLEQEPALSDRRLWAEMQEKGYDISRYLIGDLRQELTRTAGSGAAAASTPLPVPHPKPEADDFDNIIGHDGGMKEQVTQAKAAMAYPPNGLNCLIIGPSGTGKTLLADDMYQFAVRSGYLPQQAPFVVLNCADYADNPQLLISQLFGYVKGAFSGAAENKVGLVEAANGGILFLDEIHRLPSEGQEQLFYLLDKGLYRRLGDSGPMRASSVRLIAATTQNPESSLLLTFRRRIPMVITLPPLSERPRQERYAMLYYYFAKEATKLMMPLTLEPEALNVLMQYPCPGNVGQLYSDVRVCCAEAFFASRLSGSSQVTVSAELLGHVLKGAALQYYPITLRRGLVVRPGDVERRLGTQETEDDSIYETIQNVLEDQQNHRIGREECAQIIRAKLEEQRRSLQAHLKQPAHGGQLDSLVPQPLSQAVSRAGATLLPELLEKSPELQVMLAIHLDAVVRNVQTGRYTQRSGLSEVADQYPREYELAGQLLDQVGRELAVPLPQQEAAVVAMYLHLFAPQ